LLSVFLSLFIPLFVKDKTEITAVTAKYLGIGDTKARELLRNPYNGFTVRIGNRLYAHKAKLDMWLKNQVAG